ncbi:MAG: alpha/beta hydrolase [Gemmatimonadetes bacterium]|nr:alpha/beta hydrolase [Gemmatimonadota bacterium]
MRRLIAVLSLVLLLPLGYYVYANPERIALDDLGRAEVVGQYVALSAGVTRYEVAGPDTGRVAVLVHGFSVPAYIWDSTFHALALSGHRVIRYDLFGRGWSDRPDGAYDGAFFDAQLGELLDSLRIKGPVDLFGLSFGGFVAANFASTHPQRVRTLVLVDPMTSAPTLPGFLSVPVIGAAYWQTRVVPTMDDNQASDFLHPEQFPGWADRYRPQMRFRGFGRALLRSRLAAGTADFPAIYAKIAQWGTPVLLVWGKQDPTLPIADAENVTRAIPAAEFFPVDSSGHLPHLEQTAIFNARMFAFLAAHPAEPVATASPASSP